MSARACRALARRLSGVAQPAMLPPPAQGSAVARKLAEVLPREVVDDIYRSSFKRQTGVSLKCAPPQLPL